MSTDPKYKIGDSIYYHGKEPAIHGDILKYMPKEFGKPTYMIRTNTPCCYAACPYWASEDELTITEEPFIYDTEAEDNFLQDNRKLCFELGYVTKYNEDMFLREVKNV